MDNYNPRQNTRMRWKDVRELEKFSFFYGGFDIQAEQLENVSKDENWSKVANLFKNYNKTPNKKGVILYDYLQNFLCTGYLTGQYLYLYSVSETGVTYITIDYDIKIDSMRIYVEDEKFISEDNIKTIFGQNITGTGDIKLYRHQIFLTSNTTVVTIQILSSNNLKVDSAQDLTTLTNAYAGMEFTGLDSNTNKTYVVSYNGALWRMYDGSAYYNPNNFSDRVTPI